MNFKETALLLGMSMAVPATSIAQDKVEASVGADLVSGYIWRGQDLGGVSIQPSLSVAYKGFSLGAWGSAGIESADTKELDLTLGYSTGGFSISGVVHKLIAEVIEEMGMAEKAIGISPVGCAVFMYNYLDIDCQEAAHGRAPALAGYPPPEAS